MKNTATIEIPKGGDRRIHMSYDKSGFVDLGPIKEHITLNDGVMPVHYGYIEGTINEKDGDEIDVIVFSKNEYKTGDKVEIEILGILTREDGDHKVIARDGSVSDSVFEELPTPERELILGYLGFKSPIVSIETKEVAEGWVGNCKKT